MQQDFGADRDRDVAWRAASHTSINDIEPFLNVISTTLTPVRTIFSLILWFNAATSQCSTVTFQCLHNISPAVSLGHTHTCTRTHARTHTHTRAHTHTRTYIRDSDLAYFRCSGKKQQDVNEACWISPITMSVFVVFNQQKTVQTTKWNVNVSTPFLNLYISKRMTEVRK